MSKNRLPEFEKNSLFNHPIFIPFRHHPPYLFYRILSFLHNTCPWITYLDKVGHGEVHDVVFPRQLQNDVRMQEVVTLE